MSATPCALTSGGRSAPERHFQTQPIARHDLAPEFRVVHATQIGERADRRPFPLEQQHGCRLAECLDHEDTRHERRTRKVALEEFFADRDVLHGDESSPGLVLDDRVYQKGRIAVRHPLEQRGDIGGHRRQAMCLGGRPRKAPVHPARRAHGMRGWYREEVPGAAPDRLVTVRARAGTSRVSKATGLTAAAASAWGPAASQSWLVSEPASRAAPPWSDSEPALARLPARDLPRRTDGSLPP